MPPSPGRSVRVFVAIAAAGVVVVTLDRGNQGLVHRRDAYRFLLGGAVTGAVVVIIAVLTGSHPADLVRGVFIDPTKYSNGFTIPLALRLRVEVWGVVCLAGAVLYRRYRNRNSPLGVVDSCVHVVVGLLILYFALQQAQVAFSVSFAWALPLLFFAAVPRSVRPNRSARPEWRWWLSPWSRGYLPTRWPVPKFGGRRSSLCRSACSASSTECASCALTSQWHAYAHVASLPVSWRHCA